MFIIANTDNPDQPEINLCLHFKIAKISKKLRTIMVSITYNAN